MAYLTGGTWQPMKKYLTDFFGTDPDRYTVVHPAAELICEGLRLDIVPQAGQRVGLLDLDLQVKTVR